MGSEWPDKRDKTGFGSMVSQWVCSNKLKVYNMYKQSWELTLQDSPRATFYRAIKSMHAKSNCVEIVNIVWHRLTMIKLIMSSRSPEDEYHMILICPLYDDIKNPNF